MPIVKQEPRDFSVPLQGNGYAGESQDIKLTANGSMTLSSLVPLSPVELFNNTVTSGSLQNEETPLMTPPAFSFGLDWSSDQSNGGDRHHQHQPNVDSTTNNITNAESIGATENNTSIDIIEPSDSTDWSSLFASSDIPAENGGMPSVDASIFSASSTTTATVEQDSRPIKQEHISSFSNPTASERLRSFLINGTSGIALDDRKLALLSKNALSTDFTLYAKSPPSPPSDPALVQSLSNSSTCSSSNYPHNQCDSSSVPQSSSQRTSSDSADLPMSEHFDPENSLHVAKSPSNTGTIPRSKEEKAMWKRIRNTEAARRSRARKIVRLAELEEKCEALNKRNRDLEAEVFNLRLMLATGQSSLLDYNRSN